MSEILFDGPIVSFITTRSKRVLLIGDLLMPEASVGEDLKDTASKVTTVIAKDTHLYNGKMTSVLRNGTRAI